MEEGNKTGADVVSFAGYVKTMGYNPIAEVEAYWEGLRGTRVVPLRSEVDPRGIERALEYTFLIERIAPGLARFRLAGMQLNDLMGMEVRGMPLTSFFTPDARPQMQEVLNSVFEGPKAVSLSLNAETGMGKPPLSARMVVLPLKSDLGDISRALGCFQIEGKVGRAPRRFLVQNVRFRELGPFKTPQPTETAPEAPAPVQKSGFAEKKEDFKPAPRPTVTKGRPYLRLVADNDPPTDT